MKRREICILILILFLSTTLFGGPANDKIVTVKQPDGTEIRLRLFGDELFCFAETMDGFTAIRTQNGFWMYAEKTGDGALRSTNVVVHNPEMRLLKEKQFLESMIKHLRPHQLPEKERLRLEMMRRLDVKRIQSLRKKGNQIIWRVVVILVEFPDLAHTETVQSFDDMFNQEDWDGGIGAQGGFNDFYKEVSYNQFGIVADIYGWYATTMDHTYYSWSHNDHWARARELANNMIAMADVDIDYSQYDNDGDGYVDQVIIVHAGHGAAEEGNEEYIWPHYFCLSSPVTRDGVQIQDYTMQEELHYNRHAGVGMYCHEFGHALGLPDLYDTNSEDGSDSEGIGLWGVMAGGAWGNDGLSPTHFCAWSKIQLGWIIPSIVNINTQQTDFTLNAIETNPLQAFKLIPPEANTKEYFLLENRQQVGFDSYAPGTGMLIYHIDDNMYDNANAARKRVDVEEADGMDDLEYFNNRGDTGDPYPGSSLNRFFTKSSYPNSDLYSQDHSGVSVRGVQENGNLVSVKIEIDEPDSSSGIISEGMVVSYNDFELSGVGALPTGWSQTGSGVIFSIENSIDAHDETNGDWTCTPHQGDKAIFIGENWVGSGPTTLSLVTPTLNLGSATHPVLSFYEIRAWDHLWPSTKSQHTLNILVSSSGSAEWTKITSVVADMADFQNWTQQVVDLSTYAGQTIQIAFQFISHHYFWGLDEVTLTDVSTGIIEPGIKIPNRYQLMANYPNPFNPVTVIPFTLPRETLIELIVYDILGREVKILKTELMDPGVHHVTFDANNLSSGIYFYKLQTKDFKKIRKCVFIK